MKSTHKNIEKPNFLEHFGFDLSQLNDPESGKKIEVEQIGACDWNINFIFKNHKDLRNPDIENYLIYLQRNPRIEKIKDAFNVSFEKDGRTFPCCPVTYKGKKTTKEEVGLLLFQLAFLLKIITFKKWNNKNKYHKRNYEEISQAFDARFAAEQKKEADIAQPIFDIQELLTPEGQLYGWQFQYQSINGIPIDFIKDVSWKIECLAASNPLINQIYEKIKIEQNTAVCKINIIVNLDQPAQDLLFQQLVTLLHLFQKHCAKNIKFFTVISIVLTEFGNVFPEFTMAKSEDAPKKEPLSSSDSALSSVSALGKHKIQSPVGAGIEEEKVGKDSKDKTKKRARKALDVASASERETPLAALTIFNNESMSPLREDEQIDENASAPQLTNLYDENELAIQPR